MKKTLAPLLALSGTLIFAYLTRPRLSIPHLQALSKKTNQDKTNATFHYTPQGAFLLPSQTTVKIDSKTAAANAWHDAMAADVPRQMIEQEAYRPGSQDASIEDKDWEAIDEAPGIFKAKQTEEKPTTAKEMPSSSRTLATTKNQNVPFAKNSNRFPLRAYPKDNPSYSQKTYAEKYPHLDQNKRLLMNWIRSGQTAKNSSQQKKSSPPRKTATSHFKKNSEKSDRSDDLLKKTYRFARQKTRLSMRRLKAAKRKSERLKNLRQKTTNVNSSIARLLGKKSIRAPKNKSSPLKNPWNQKMPPIPEGQTRPTQGLNYADIESIHLPPSKATKSGAWITDGNALYYHKGSQWGVSVNGGWGWIVKNHETEFLYLSPDTDPLLKSHGHWWTKKQGTLLIYHDGQGLGAEELSQWNQDQKNSNLKTTIRYSSDLKRMAIISSKSLTVFNLDTGDKIQEISLHQNLR